MLCSDENCYKKAKCFFAVYFVCFPSVAPGQVGWGQAGASGSVWPGDTGLQLCWDVMGDVDQGEVREGEEEADTKRDVTSLGVTHAVPSSVSM